MELLPEVQKRIKNNLLLCKPHEIAELAKAHGMTRGKFTAMLAGMGIEWDVIQKGKRRRPSQKTAELDIEEYTVYPTSDVIFPQVDKLLCYVWDRENKSLNPYVAFDNYSGEVLGIYSSLAKCNLDFGYTVSYHGLPNKTAIRPIHIERLEEVQERLKRGEPLVDFPLLPADVIIPHRPYRQRIMLEAVEVYDRRTGRLLATLPSLSEASKYAGLSKTYVGKIVRGERVNLTNYDFRVINKGDSKVFFADYAITTKEV